MRRPVARFPTLPSCHPLHGCWGGTLNIRKQRPFHSRQVDGPSRSSVTADVQVRGPRLNSGARGPLGTGTLAHHGELPGEGPGPHARANIRPCKINTVASRARQRRGQAIPASAADPRWREAPPKATVARWPACGSFGCRLAEAFRCSFGVPGLLALPVAQRPSMWRDQIIRLLWMCPENCDSGCSIGRGSTADPAMLHEAPHRLMNARLPKVAAHAIDG